MKSGEQRGAVKDRECKGTPGFPPLPLFSVLLFPSFLSVPFPIFKILLPLPFPLASLSLPLLHTSWVLFGFSKILLFVYCYFRACISSNFYFGRILNFLKICRNSTRKSCIPFAQVHSLFTLCSVGCVILSLPPHTHTPTHAHKHTRTPRCIFFLNHLRVRRRHCLYTLRCVSHPRRRPRTAPHHSDQNQGI